MRGFDTLPTMGGANQPPGGFYGSEPATVPARVKRSRAPLGLIAALLGGVAGLVAVGGAVAMISMSRSAPDPTAGSHAVPEDGLRHYALRWTLESSPVQTTLRAVWVSYGTAHAVGDQGTIVTRDRSGVWAAQNSTTKVTLHAVTNTAAGMMAVGDEGTVIRFDRTKRAWVREESGSKASLRAVIAIGRDVFIVGDKGLVLRRNEASQWGSEPSGVDADLYAVSAPARNSVDGSVYAAGTDGTILYRSSTDPVVQDAGGSPWVVQQSGTKEALRSMSGELHDLVVVGDGGALLRLRTSADTPWMREQVPGGTSLFGVGFARVPFELRRPHYSESGSEQAWLVVGKGGFAALRAQDDGAWHVIDSLPTKEDLHAVWGGGDMLVVVGANGTILTAPISGTASEPPMEITVTTRPPAPAATPEPSTATPVPALPPAPGATFSRSAALASINGLRGAAQECKQAGGTQGKTRVAITFAPNGRVTVSQVSGAPFAGTPVGGCIAAAFRSATVPPFEGDAVTVHTSVVIP